MRTFLNISTQIDNLPPNSRNKVLCDFLLTLVITAHRYMQRFRSVTHNRLYVPWDLTNEQLALIYTRNRVKIRENVINAEMLTGYFRCAKHRRTDKVHMRYGRYECVDFSYTVNQDLDFNPYNLSYQQGVDKSIECVSITSSVEYKLNERYWCR